RQCDDDGQQGSLQCTHGNTRLKDRPITQISAGAISPLDPDQRSNNSHAPAVPSRPGDGLPCYANSASARAIIDARAAQIITVTTTGSLRLSICWIVRRVHKLGTQDNPTLRQKFSSWRDFAQITFAFGQLH
ncbi:MAG TPA: hypothetical protein VGD96_03035, partial [Bradyrhizobium sp.]